MDHDTLLTAPSYTVYISLIIVQTSLVQIEILVDFLAFSPKFELFMKNSNTELQTDGENGLFLLSRSLNIVLAFWANFRPLRSKISVRTRGTPTFY